MRRICNTKICTSHNISFTHVTRCIPRRGISEWWFGDSVILIPIDKTVHQRFTCHYSSTMAAPIARLPIIPEPIPPAAGCPITEPAPLVPTGGMFGWGIAWVVIGRNHPGISPAHDPINNKIKPIPKINRIDGCQFLTLDAMLWLAIFDCIAPFDAEAMRLLRFCNTCGLAKGKPVASFQRY